MTDQDSHERSPVASKMPFFGKRANSGANSPGKDSDEEGLRAPRKIPKWSFGVLNDPDTIEVPGKPSLLIMLNLHKPDML